MPEDSKDKEPGEESNSSSERHERIDIVEAAALAGLPFPSFEEKIPKEELEELKAYYELVQEEALSREEASQPSDVLAELNKLFQKPSYKLLKEIGHGAFGSVYEGRNALDGSVAIKILSSGFKHCITEGQAAVRVKSDYAVMIHAHGELADGRMYLVMDLVEGEFDDPSLQAYIKPGPKHPPEEKILRWMKQISNGMQNAHKANVIHRDLKPKNILIDISRNKEGRARICDFGLARIEADSDSPPEDLGSDSEVLDVSKAISDSPELSSAESESIYKSQAYFAGTAHYSAPEQVKDTREANELSDIYSFGATFYHLASGEFPMGNMTILEVEELKKEPVENIPAPKELNKLNQNLSEGICFLIMDCLKNKSFDRPGSFEDILADLKEIENQTAFDKGNLEREKELKRAEIPELDRRKIHACRVKAHNARTFERKIQRAAILRERGREYHEEGALRRAIAMYTRTLYFHSEDIVALVSRGRAYNSAGNYDRAIADLTKAISIDGERAAAWRNRGYSYDGKGELDKAIKNYDEAIRLDPEYVPAWVNRGYSYDEKGELDKAIENYDEAIRLDPEYVLAWNSRGICYRQKDEFDKAIENYDEAIRLKPEYAFAQLNRGVCYNEKGDHDEAIKNYDEAIRLKPKNAFAWYGRGYSCFKKQESIPRSIKENDELDKAIKDCDEAIRLDPKYADPWHVRGICYRKKGELDKAIKDCDEAIRLNPEYAGMRTSRSVCYRIKGELDKAIKDCDEAIRLDPECASAWNSRSICYRKKGELDKAIKDCDEAIRLDPEYAYAWNRRAWTLVKIGAFDRAIADSSEAIRLAPKNASAWDTRGFVYAQKGELDKAIKDYDQAIRLDPGDPGFWHFRGLAHQGAGNQAAAEADFRKAAELGYIEENEK